MSETTKSELTIPEQGDRNQEPTPVDLEPLRIQALRDLGALPEKPSEN